MPDDKQKVRDTIRVLIVAPAAPLVGGQAIQAKRLFEKFQCEQGIEPRLQPVNPAFFPNLQKIKYVRTVLTTIKYIADLVRVIPAHDVIHIFSASYYSFLLAPAPAVLISRLFRKKTILNYRSGEARDHLTRWRSAIPIIRMFGKVVVPSGYLVDVFAEFGIGADAIFNSVDLDRFRFRERTPLRPVFLSNRNFEPLYNVACTLRSFAIIQKEFPDALLIVVGEGSEKAKLVELAENLDLKNVEFTGSISPDDMPGIYDRADIYLNSPNIDNMPSSVIEAFSCGLPVVSTDVGGIPYIIEHNKTGSLVPVNDHLALARASIRLINEPQIAQEIITRARKEVEKYTWAKVSEEWVRVYRSLSADLNR